MIILIFTRIQYIIVRLARMTVILAYIISEDTSRIYSKADIDVPINISGSGIHWIDTALVADNINIHSGTLSAFQRNRSC